MRCMEGFGQITRKMVLWLPEEGQRVARLMGWIQWGLRLRFILSNRISSQEHNAPGLGRDKLDSDTDGCTAPAAIAFSDRISATKDLCPDEHRSCGVPGRREG